MVVVRKNISVAQGDQRLFDEIRYFFYLTNDHETAAADVVFLANDRGNQENLIDQLKHGVGATRMPVDTLAEQLGLHGDGGARVDAQGVVCVAVARDGPLGRALCRREGRGPAHGIQSVSPRVHAACRCRSCARVVAWCSACSPGIPGRPSFSAASIICAGRCGPESTAETGIARPGCLARDHAPRRTDQPMSTIERQPRRAISPTGDLCAALRSRFPSSAEPQTRLFWD